LEESEYNFPFTSQSSKTILPLYHLDVMQTSELPRRKAGFDWGFDTPRMKVMLIIPIEYIYELHDMQNNIRLTLTQIKCK
jgi:hypothetical protein